MLQFLPRIKSITHYATIASIIAVCTIFVANVLAIEQNEATNISSKEATLYNNESSVAIDIQTQYLDYQKVLVFQGTFCEAHGLKNSTIIDGINSILTHADVDYFAEAKHYSNGNISRGNLKHFDSGTTIKEEDIYKTASGANGTHFITQDTLKTLVELLDNNNYDYLVMILDGAFATGVSGGSTQAIFDISLSLRLSDEQYIERRQYAEKLAKTNILYLVAPKQSGDYLFYADNGSGSYSYGAYRKYWAESNFSTINSTASRGYLRSHYFIEGLAFYAPKYYLDITDPNTGKITLTTPPEVTQIPFDTDSFVDYTEAKTVVTRMGSISDRILPAYVSIKDVLADGLIFKDASVEYSTDNGATWKEIPEDIKTLSYNNDTVEVKIKAPINYIMKAKFRVLIHADVSEEFSENKTTGKTNDECIIEYIDEDGNVISEAEPDSPEVTFSTFNVYYDEGNHGVLSGISSEEFRKNDNRHPLTGSDVVANSGYTHIGWICSDDIIIDDGSLIKRGDIITNDQLPRIVPSHTVTFTAQYKTNEIPPLPETGDNIFQALTIIGASLLVLSLQIIHKKTR